MPDEPRLIQEQEGQYNFADLPLQPVGKDPATTHYVQVVEVCQDLDQYPDLSKLHASIRDKVDPPTPFHLNDVLPGHYMQCVLTHIDGKLSMIRHFILKQRTNITLLKSALRGKLYILDCSKVNSRRHISFILQHLLEGLPGSGCYVRELVPIQKGPLRSATEIDAVFDFIRDHGPLGSADNQNLRWIEKQRNDPQSPLFQYHAPTIEKALHNLSTGKALAGAVAGYPVTLKDVRNWVLSDIVQPILNSATQFATIMLGPAGIGKTPLANSMSIALSAYWQREHGVSDGVPKFKSGNTLDFFRSEPGSLFVPAVLDDGNMATETVVALKAFLDVAGEDSRVYARWGAAFFARHQYRIACGNSFNSGAEPRT